MLKSSKPALRKQGNGTEDTKGREALGLRAGRNLRRKRKPMDGTGMKQGRKAAAERSVEGVRNPEDEAESGR